MESEHPKGPKQDIYILHDPKTGIEWLPMTKQWAALQEMRLEQGRGRRLLVLHYKLASVTED